MYRYICIMRTRRVDGEKVVVTERRARLWRILVYEYNRPRSCGCEDEEEERRRFCFLKIYIIPDNSLLSPGLCHRRRLV